MTYGSFKAPVWKGDLFLRKLAHGVFMTVQAQLGIKRKVTAELEEERTEVAISSVDVIVVHHRAAPHDPRVGAADTTPCIERSKDLAVLTKRLDARKGR